VFISSSFSCSVISPISSTGYLSTPTPNANQNTAWVYTIEQGFRTNLISYTENGQNPPMNDANKKPFGMNLHKLTYQVIKTMKLSNGSQMGCQRMKR
jgi:hypothetical protein